MSPTEKAQLMDQLRGQVAVANVQQLVQVRLSCSVEIVMFFSLPKTMSDKCFKKCVHHPGSSALDSRQQVQHVGVAVN